MARERVAQVVTCSYCEDRRQVSSPNLNFFVELVDAGLEGLLLIPAMHIDHLLHFGASNKDQLSVHFMEALFKHARERQAITS